MVGSFWGLSRQDIFVLTCVSMLSFAFPSLNLVFHCMSCAIYLFFSKCITTSEFIKPFQSRLLIKSSSGFKILTERLTPRVSGTKATYCHKSIGSQISLVPLVMELIVCSCTGHLIMAVGSTKAIGILMLFLCCALLDFCLRIMRCWGGKTATQKKTAARSTGFCFFTLRRAYHVELKNSA